MSLHLVVIDALNLIRRVHAAQPNPDDIDATSRVCCQALTKIINFSEPTHIIAVFDHLGEDRGWRAELLPEYKIGRKPMPDALLKSLDRLQEDFWQLGIDSLLSDGDEADDLIATIALKVAGRGEKVTIISTDKGFCQLLQPTLQIRDYFQQRWLDSAYVEKEFGVAPHRLTDYWGLAGISSSKVSGVPGIGPKATKELLETYENLEAVLSASDVLPKYAKKIDGHQDDARVAKQVASLKTDILLGFNLQDIRYDPS